jgi:hypothetical protein
VVKELLENPSTRRRELRIDIENGGSVIRVADGCGCCG